MKVNLIKHSREYTFHGLSRWIGMEASIDENDDEKESLHKLEQIAKEFVQESLKQTLKSTTTEMQPPEPDVLPVIQERKVTPGMQFIIDKINKATTPEQLEKERTRADMNPELKKVFDEQMKKLKP